MKAAVSLADTYFTILNEAAGGGRAAGKAAQVFDQLRNAGLSLEVRRTERPGHATDLAQRGYETGYRRFLSVGGDGTTFEVINGIHAARAFAANAPPSGDNRVTLGILPLGTGNSFLRDFNIQTEAQAIAALIRQTPRHCDVVQVTHQAGSFVYINLLSIGFSAKVGDLTNKRFKRFGPAGYGLAVTASLLSLEAPMFSLTLDGVRDDRPSTLLSFSNSRFTGGTMEMAPSANPSDGELDVIRVHPMGRFQLLRTFPKIYQGTHVSAGGVEASRAQIVEFHNLPRLPVMVDGEVMELELQKLEVVPHAIEVLT